MKRKMNLTIKNRMVKRMITASKKLILNMRIVTKRWYQKCSKGLRVENPLTMEYGMISLTPIERGFAVVARWTSECSRGASSTSMESTLLSLN